MKQKNLILGKVKGAVQTAILGASIAMMTLPVYAAGEGGSDIPAEITAGNLDLKQTISRAINLVMGFVVAGGIISIVLGIRNLAAGVSDDGGGQDQQKISKGRFCANCA